MLAHGEQLAVHVSKNEEVKYLAEDDQEGLVMTVHAYLTLSKQGVDGTVIDETGDAD